MRYSRQSQGISFRSSFSSSFLSCSTATTTESASLRARLTPHAGESTYDGRPLGITQVPIRVRWQLVPSQLLEAAGSDADSLLVIDRGVAAVAVADADADVVSGLHGGGVGEMSKCNGWQTQRGKEQERSERGVKSAREWDQPAFLYLTVRYM